jgi:hypothetical protein
MDIICMYTRYEADIQIITDINKFPPRFKAALQSQDHIGW